MTGAAKNTVAKLLADMGTACATFHDFHVRNLKVRRMQADEIWCFIGCKRKNASPAQKAEGWGDVWTWVGMDADSKLAIGYLVGGRDGGWARDFMEDCASRIRNRVQLTTDAHRAYLEAVLVYFTASASGTGSSRSGLYIIVLRQCEVGPKHYNGIWCGSPQQITLCFISAHVLDQFQLLRCLNTLGDHPHPKILG